VKTLCFLSNPIRHVHVLYLQEISMYQILCGSSYQYLQIHNMVYPCIKKMLSTADNWFDTVGDFPNQRRVDVRPCFI